MDYDDLLIYLAKLMKEDDEAAARINDAYRYVMVDEYQDTNLIQADIVEKLAGPSQNITVVGDDAQSIYSFRGATVDNILQFPRRFSGTRVIRLEENYRSIQPILDVTNRIISQAPRQFQKKLFTRNAEGEHPLRVCAQNENAQSVFVTDKIMELRDQGMDLSEMAVLFRAGFHSFDLEIELNRAKIPFVKMGGFKFMESAHIKDFLAHLRVRANPGDRLSWYRILLLLNNVGPKTARNLFEKVIREKTGCSGILAVKAKPAFKEGLDRLKSLLTKLDTKVMKPMEMGEAVLQYYTPILKQNHDDHPKRERDLQQLLAIMERYKSLDRFLSDMALEPPAASRDGMMDEGGKADRLTLSTVHSAKGLEWRAVFIIWALDGRFPSMHCLSDPEELEEELRLMYVAATRAKEQLFAVYPDEVFDRFSGGMITRPSRFLDAVPEEMMPTEYANL